MLRILTPPLLFMLPLLIAPPASAASQAWSAFEARLPLAEGRAWVPKDLRLVTEPRFGLSRPGVHQLLVRTGPIWAPTSWLTLALHGTSAIYRTDAGTYNPEYRVELEPSASWAWGPLKLQNRHRMEMRWRPDRDGWRYRNRLSVRHANLLAGDWGVYAKEEVFVEIGPGLDQNRLSAGVDHRLTDGANLGLGLLLRSDVAAGGWSHALMTTVSLSYEEQGEPFIGGSSGGF